MTLVIVAIAWMVGYGRRPDLLRRPTRVRSHADRSRAELRLAMLLQIGLAAGLSVRSCLVSVKQHVAPDTAAAIDAALREGLLIGLTRSLGSGHHDRLFRILADAQASGAPATLALGAFIADETERLRTAVAERARTLPVRLAIPVALGLLPGFVLLAVAPQIVLALRQMLSQIAGL